MSSPALVTALRQSGASRVLLPGDPDAAASLGAFDTSIGFTPRAIVAATGIADVVATVAVAAREGVPLVALGTGHGMLGDVGGGILLATRGFSGVTVDPEEHTARVVGGATWSDVLEVVTPHGLAALCGSAPGVGVISYLLGGGLGPIAREFGYSADHVRAIEVVTPAHGALTVSAKQHPELFWGLRGGKSGLGIVTAVTIDLFPMTDLYGGGIYFAAEAVRDVFQAVAEWAPALPESSTASIAILRLPPAKVLPEPLRGRTVAHVRFASTSEPSTAADQLKVIRSTATPLADTIGVLPYSAIGTIHGDPATPMPVMSGGATLDTLGTATLDALLDIAGPDRQLPVSAVELRCLGGALARPATHPNAVGGRNAAWNLFASASPDPGLDAATRRAHVRSVIDAIRPWRSPVNLINFVGRANDERDVRRAWSADQAERLRRVRALVDPDGVLRPR
jgi:FAD/FMN-containing dehydrogenase